MNARKLFLLLSRIYLISRPSRLSDERNGTEAFMEAWTRQLQENGACNAGQNRCLLHGGYSART